MTRLFHKINELIQEGQKLALATITAVKGSSPRDPGAKMIIIEDGTVFGSIGGDFAERAVIDEALNALHDEKYRKFRISLEEEENGGIGMKCGGEIEVFIDVIKPYPKLLITGSGRIASNMAELADKIGFMITVIDPYINKCDFPETVKTIKEPVEKGLSQIEITGDTYIAIITRHEHDIPSLKSVIGKGAAYIGLMGSHSRVKAQFRELEERGYSKEELSKIHAPIGLDIGAETPEEIAISILAEIIKQRRSPKSSGESLKISL